MTKVLQPPNRTTALLASLTAANSTDLADLSISRPSSRLQWGIPVPNDDSQTIYVWIDALVNYLTGVGYPWSSTVLATATVEETDSELEAARIQELEKDRLARKAEAEQLRSEGELVIRSDEGEKIWPPDVMVIGKDIIKSAFPLSTVPSTLTLDVDRFHALYFPAMLMALDLPLPKKILAHGHWTMDKFKMSKSRGNVADPIAAMELCGTDAFRCFLMRRGAVGSDNGESLFPFFHFMLHAFDDPYEELRQVVKYHRLLDRRAVDVLQEGSRRSGRKPPRSLNVGQAAQEDASGA